MEDTQTPQVTDIRQSLQYGKYMESIGWVVEGNNPQVFIRKLGVLGAIAKIQRFKELNWEQVRPILRKHRVWMTKMEPLHTSVKFRQDSWPMLATKTLRVDLAPPLSKIFDSLKKDARYSLRKLEASKHTIELNNFDAFYHLWKKAAKIKSLWIPNRREFNSLVKCFGKNCFCIIVDDLAGSLVLIYDGTAYYFYSGALPEGKAHDLPYLVIWECMKEAKKRKCTLWDFEGIYDSRWPNKGWRGFSHFKKSFGGYEIEFPGSFTKWF